MCIFLMSQVSLNSKIRFLSQKVCPVARSQTDIHTDRVTTEGTLSGFQDFFLQPIIKDRRPNTHTPQAFFPSISPVSHIPEGTPFQSRGGALACHLVSCLKMFCVVCKMIAVWNTRSVAYSPLFLEVHCSSSYFRIFGSCSLLCAGCGLTCSVFSMQ